MLHEISESLGHTRPAIVGIAKSVEMQAAILNALPAHIALIDHEGVILEVNESWHQFALESRMTASASKVGQNYLLGCQAFYGDSSNAAKSAVLGIRKVLSGEAAQFGLDYACPSANREQWFRLMVTPLSPYALTGAVVMHVDITRRKALEDAMYESEARLRTIFESEPECVTVVSIDGRLVDINPAGLRMAETQDRRQVLDLPILKLIHPGDHEAFLTLHEAAVQGRSGEKELRFVGLQGKVRWVESRATPLREAGGEVSSVLSVNRDITERKQSAERLTEQASLLDQAADAILVRDLQHRITYWNKGAERLYGWSHTEALAASDRELLHAHDTASFDAAYEQLLESGEWLGELQKVSKSGHKIIVQARWTLLRDDQQQPKAVLTINTDITERKKLEQQFFRAQRLESIGTLAGGIAHDLNNVLTPIRMAIDLLRLHENNPARLAVLETIDASARRGADMVSQVLSFARGVEGQQIPVNLRQVLREVAKIAEETFLKAIEVRSVMDPGLWKVQGDATQLHQVLLNLCVNARDAMPESGILTISAQNLRVDDQFSALEAGACAGPHVAIQIEDTGMGMSPETVQRMFEPFFTTKETGKGTGLGLSTSLGIIKSHKGFVRVYSELGRGTRIKVYLPALTDIKGGGEDDSVTVEHPRGSGDLILLVDDEDAVRQITRRTLEAFGYRVIVACDGADGVGVYAAHKDEIAAVVTDIMMPVMDGFAMINVIMRLNPQARIIAASGLNANGMAARALNTGVKKFIPKPYTASSLLTALRDVCDRAEV